MAANLAWALLASALDASEAMALLALPEQSEQLAAKMMPLLEQREREVFAILH